MNKKKQSPEKRGPQKIRDVITDLMARRGYAQVEAHEECREAWQKVVGDLKRFSRATEVKRGVLYVMVSNSVVMQELTFRKQELVDAMATALPDHRISDIRFRVGAVN